MVLVDAWAEGGMFVGVARCRRRAARKCQVRELLPGQAPGSRSRCVGIHEELSYEPTA